MMLLGNVLHVISVSA